MAISLPWKIFWYNAMPADIHARLGFKLGANPKNIAHELKEKLTHHLLASSKVTSADILTTLNHRDISHIRLIKVKGLTDIKLNHQSEISITLDTELLTHIY